MIGIGMPISQSNTERILIALRLSVAAINLHGGARFLARYES